MTRLLNRLKGWRTVIANVLFAIVPVLQLTELQAVLPAEWLPYYALVVALANIWLRHVTTTPPAYRQ